MPQIDGCQLSDHLGFLRPEMKVLYMSGYAGAATSQPGRIRRGVQILPKPFAAEALLRAVRQTLDESQPGKELKLIPKPELVASQSCGR